MNLLSYIVYLSCISLITGPLCQFVLLISSQLSTGIHRAVSHGERAYIERIIQTDMLQEPHCRYTLKQETLYRHNPRSKKITQILSVTHITHPTDTLPCISIKLLNSTPIDACTPAL